MMWCSAVGFIATLILSLLAAPLTVTAQPRSTVPRIGILPPAAAASAPSLEAFRQGLRDLSLSSTLVVTIDSAAHQAYCTPELVGLANSHLGSGERSGQGHISREIFVNEAIYQQEQEQIFARTWLLVGHESQIPTPGAYFVSCMGEESVILTRDSRQQVHVFLNTCRHRGMKVCRYDEGNTTVFTCPYHGWSYATDGRLVGVPYYKEAYRERLDRSQWGLVEVA